MARAFFAFGIAYDGVAVAGFASLGNLNKPLQDPYFGIIEGLVIAMAPVMVMPMVAVYVCAPSSAKTNALAALGWMLAAAATTMIVHFVELTVGRGLSATAIPGYAHLFQVHVAIGALMPWTSLLGDGFVGLALLVAATAFTDARDRRARAGLLTAGALCLVGLIGPAVGNLNWRGLGILGYAIVLPLTCLQISRAFSRPAARGRMLGAGR